MNKETYSGREGTEEMFNGYKYDKNKLKELVKDGMTAYKLSQLLGKDPSTITKWLQRHPGETIDNYIDTVCDGEVKSYRGFSWTSTRDLARQLNVRSSSIYLYLKNNPDKSETDYIDMKLSIITEYRGYKWKTYADLSVQLGKDRKFVTTWLHNHKKDDVRKCIDCVILNEPKSYRGFSWTSARDLSIQLNKGERCVSSWLHIHPDCKIEDYIDMILDQVNTYRGIIWTTDRDLSIKLGRNKECVGFWIRRHPNKTRENYIDLCLGDLTYDEYKNEKGIH